MNKDKWFYNWKFLVLLLSIGVFVFIPDPLDFVFGLGEIFQAVSLLAASVLIFLKNK